MMIFHLSFKQKPRVCVCFHGLMMQMKGKALGIIDERCHSVLLRASLGDERHDL